MVPRRVIPPPPFVDLLAERERWLVAAAPPVLAQRMCSPRPEQAAPEGPEDTTTESQTAECTAAEGGADKGNGSAKKSKASSRAQGKQIKLYNKVVSIDQQPSCYPYK